MCIELDHLPYYHVMVVRMYNLNVYRLIIQCHNDALIVAAIVEHCKNKSQTNEE